MPVFKIVRSRLGSIHPEAVGTESEPSSIALRGDDGCDDRFLVVSDIDLTLEEELEEESL